jgi:hypothetical protein
MIQKQVSFRLVIEYIFIINLFRNTNANTIYYKLNQTSYILLWTDEVLTTRERYYKCGLLSLPVTLLLQLASKLLEVICCRCFGINSGNSLSLSAASGQSR